MSAKRIMLLTAGFIAVLLMGNVAGVDNVQADTPPPGDYVIDNFDDGSHTVWAKANINNPGESGGEFYGTCANNDPYMSRTVNFSANTFKYVSIRLKMASGSGTTAQIFWVRSGEGYAEARSKFFTIVADGKYRTYTVDLSAQANWSGTIVGFRFDAPSGSTGKVFRLDYITAGNMIFLDNGTTRVGVRMDWGGAISEIVAVGVNFINNNDTGRLVQVSLYDGDGYYPSNCMDPNWSWNPVQGGDKYNHGSPVVAHSVSNGVIYTKTRPYEWNPDNKGGGSSTPVQSDVYVEQWVSLVPNMGDLAVKVRYKVTHFGTDNHAMSNSQEFPCVYVNNGFTNMYTYEGASPWTSASCTRKSLSWTPTLWHSSEFWQAFCSNGSNFGITMYTPQQNRFPQFEAHLMPDSYCNYMRPYTQFDIPANAVINNTVYFFVGNYPYARSLIYSLHSSETVKTDWLFSSANDAEGWYRWNQLTPFTVSGGYLGTTSTGGDPFLGNCWEADFPATSYKKIEIRMKVSSGTFGQIFFTTLADGTWNGAKSKGFTVTPDSSYHTYTINMSTVAGWTGRIRQIRLDPTTANGATISIDHIKLKP